MGIDLKNKKSISLRRLFLRYLIWLGIGLGIGILIPVTLFVTGVVTGQMTYSNKAEVYINEMTPIISSAVNVKEVLRYMPRNIKYALVDGDYSVIEDNMDEEGLEIAIDFAKGNRTFQGERKVYKLIELEDSYVVIQYYIGSQFTNDWLNDYIPSPELFFLVLIIFNCITACIVITIVFARSLRKQLDPLLEATDRIKEQDLEFEAGFTKITELNDVMDSITDMRDRLKVSLEEQWRMEQNKREQISALAHDLKTPLTVIRGNAELLKDTKQDSEQVEYTNYVEESAARVEQYVRTLIEISKAESGYNLTFETVNTEEFIEEVLRQANALAGIKKIQVGLMVQEDLPAQFIADRALFNRAIMNIVSNGIEYCPDEGQLCINVRTCNNFLQFVISDSGKGFTREGLTKAARQFYREDPSRNSTSHYGMGLYIADSIVKQHEGRMYIENSNKLGGGMLTIELPANLANNIKK